ncbi:hypothetical protein N8I77_001504 [Diaporthe amygdali]|uniref:Uncharacterized protein n=1 Tax=Phomopsis amygdali TaxID=1214568 RepID=A0AAD9SS35_PHOAM|nr:hypothetical protein N8I77_001504 [Diaporthe amygdali]
MQLTRCAVLLFSFLSFAHLHLAQQLPNTLYYSNESLHQALNNQSTDANGICSPERIGAGPRPEVDTPEEFLNFTTLFATARIASTPLGYKLVGQALNGSMYGKVFQGLYYLDEYNPALCASECNEIEDCSAFNVYYERDPTISPSYNGCPNPPSTTNIKCVLWGQSINTDISLNWGEDRCDFKVVVAGSNCYIKQAARNNLTDLGFFGPRGDAVPGSTFPHSQMIEPEDGYLTFLEVYREIYATDGEGPSYDPAVCAENCNALTKYNSKNRVNQHPYINGAYPKCNMFNMFEVSMISDNNPIAFVCFFYSTSWDSLYSTEMSGVDPEGRHLHASMVKVYQRLDYTDPPLCALEECKGAQYYRGGNCSGWGPEYCQHKSDLLE